MLDPPYHAWWSTSGRPPAGLTWLRSAADSQGALRGVCEELRRRTDGKPDCIYLFGFSAGASHRAGARRPDLSRCGLLPEGREALRCRVREGLRPLHAHLQDVDAVERSKRDEHVRETRGTSLACGNRQVVRRHLPQSLRTCVKIRSSTRSATPSLSTSSDLVSRTAGAASIPTGHERPGIENQKILEIWFRGSHSDVGGGYKDDAAHGFRCGGC